MVSRAPAVLMLSQVGILHSGAAPTSWLWRLPGGHRVESVQRLVLSFLRWHHLLLGLYLLRLRSLLNSFLSFFSGKARSFSALSLRHESAVGVLVLLGQILWDIVVVELLLKLLLR